MKKLVRHWTRQRGSAEPEDFLSLDSLRGDFIKRLFSVAMSVGFATQVGRQGWLVDGHLPNLYESEGLSRLAVTIIVVIASWEGYFLYQAQNANRKADFIRDSTRLYIDIIIVLLYVILFNTINNQKVWHWTLVAVFVSYSVWDLLGLSICSGSNRRPVSHSVPWFLALLSVALLVTYGPPHHFRYVLAAFVCVMLFRLKPFGPSLLAHTLASVGLTVVCVAARHYWF